MEFKAEITIVKVEKKTSTTGQNAGKEYELVTILTDGGASGIVNKGKPIIFKSPIMTGMATLKLSLGKYTSLSLLNFEG